MTPRTVRLGARLVGDGQPVYIVAEIGINHNADVGIAKALIDVAARAGCDAVKFQKRTPDRCVPVEQRDVMRDTPWGRMTYMDYRRRMEFGIHEYREIDAHCRSKPIEWFASCWDEPSVEFIRQFHPGCYKVASASLTDDALLNTIRATGSPILLSTGMSTMDQIRHAVSLVDTEKLLLLHTISRYPCSNDEVNLRVLHTLRREFDVPVGYSGHERGLQVSLAATALGACVLERHVTLDRTLWGTDQAASIEPAGLERLVRDVRIIEQAMGDGVKRLSESELLNRDRLRQIRSGGPD